MLLDRDTGTEPKLLACRRLYLSTQPISWFFLSSKGTFSSQLITSSTWPLPLPPPSMPPTSTKNCSYPSMEIQLSNKYDSTYFSWMPIILEVQVTMSKGDPILFNLTTTTSTVLAWRLSIIEIRRWCLGTVGWRQLKTGIFLWAYLWILLDWG